MQNQQTHQQQANWHRPIKGVAFDMDGLLLNTEDLYKEVIDEILRRRGRVFRPETRRQMMGQPPPKAWQVLIDHEGLDPDWGPLQKEAESIFIDLYHRLAPLPGVHELIDYLCSRSIPRCVATSSRREFADRALKLVGIYDRMDFIVTAEDVERGKPSPDIYLLAASRMSVEPEEMLVLEDSGNGARAGVESGACVVAVPTEHSRDHTFERVASIVGSLEDRTIYSLLGSV